MTLKGTLIFIENYVPALSLYSASIELLPSTHLYLSDSRFSGGLNILNCSSVIVNNGVNLFLVNSGVLSAIYVETCSLNKPGSRDCFIRHINSSLHPNEWGINVTFIGNEGANMNSI